MKKNQPKFVFCLCTRLQDIDLTPEMQEEAQLGSCTGEEKGLCIFTGALSSAKVQQHSQTSDSKAHLVGDQMPEGQRKGRGAARGEAHAGGGALKKHRREPGVGGRAAELAAAECWVMGRRVKVD